MVKKEVGSQRSIIRMPDDLRSLEMTNAIKCKDEAIFQIFQQQVNSWAQIQSHMRIHTIIYSVRLVLPRISILAFSRLMTYIYVVPHL
jgi:hypothetical protein